MTFNTVAVEVFEAEARRLPAESTFDMTASGRPRSERYSGH